MLELSNPAGLTHAAGSETEMTAFMNWHADRTRLELCDLGLRASSAGVELRIVVNQTPVRSYSFVEHVSQMLPGVKLSGWAQRGDGQ